MNLLDVYKELNTEAKCIAFLEHMRWPDGVKCLACESLRITPIVAKGKRNKKTGKVGPDRHLYQCLNPECKHQFTATAGTIFNDTHLPLNKWFYAIVLIANAIKGLSAKQVQRDACDVAPDDQRPAERDGDGIGDAAVERGRAAQLQHDKGPGRVRRKAGERA